MGSPHFSVIFKRDFPEELKHVKSFRQLQQNFKGWAKNKYVEGPYSRQDWALGIEARKLGIKNTSQQFRFKRNDKVQIRYRDVVTGKLTKSDGTFTSKKGEKK